MSVKYNDKNGVLRDISGLTPGGDLELGAVAQRAGTYVIGAVAAGGSGFVHVAFDTALPDSDYEIVLYPSETGERKISCYANAINADGFNVIYSNMGSTALSNFQFKWKAFKVYTLQYAEQNASDITTIKSYIPATTSSSNKLVNASELADVDLEDLSDVDVTSIVDGQTLIWDDTNSKWVNGQGGKVYTEGLGIDIDANDKISVDQTYVPTTFTGTTAEWNALSAAEKAKYTLVSLTDDADYVGNIVDAVTNGEMSAVTSNAVYGALLGKLDSSKIKYGISSNAVDTTGSITFDTAFADANYIVFICPINSNDAIAWSSSVISKTASGFVFETKYQTTNSTTWISYYRGIGWLAVHL